MKDGYKKVRLDAAQTEYANYPWLILFTLGLDHR